MTKVSVDQIRERLQGIHARRQHYEWKSEQPGRLRRHEMWRHTYLADPYLIGAPDDRVAERFRHIFMNTMELTQEGKIAPVPFTETDEYVQVFTHMLEEYQARVGGEAPPDVIALARAPLVKYFEHGTPIGVTMFDGYVVPSTPVLVKYGKRQFLEPMLQTGELRLANAGLYNDTNLLDSVRDDETSRTFFIPTYKDRIAGKDHIFFDGHKMPFNDDDIVLPLIFDDYYLFSLCEHIHYRMPTDFEADAAIVIRDPIRFKQRLISTFLARLPDWVPYEGKVTYYDPYRDYSKFKVPHMAKHFGYAYQKEVRVAFRPRTEPSVPLEPLSLSVGSMTDYADLVSI
jgi:hypothetical protein